MSTTANFSNGRFSEDQPSVFEGFTPLTADQMDRMKGGFDVEEIDDEPQEIEPEPIEEPVSGELGGDLVDG